MIAFSCAHCGMKLKVKPEFAGRSSKCPTCKHPLTVPAASLTEAVMPVGDIEGSASSLARAGVDGGVLLEQTVALRTDDRSLRDLLAQRSSNTERYVIEREIARGGMGAVLRAVDCDLRREVAIKYLLDQSDPRKKLRFVEEAQITGQLEHPNIVPIHELGVDKDKRLFFSMKMVKGRSLSQVLDELRKNPKPAEKEFSLARLLNIFVNVCHALAYAHSSGVVHRDLKPGNIMVGDFGEVYVMDWGLAKVLSDGGPVSVAAPTSPPTAILVSPKSDSSISRNTKVQTSRDVEADLTQEGSVLGTPAYMPPEQAAGHIQDVDRQSDVYSLGAILYEMLTLQAPIEKDGGYIAVLMRAAQGAIVPPEQRNPERARAGKVPRELAAIAMKALASSKANRYGSVEALRLDIERFQEGRSVSATRYKVREVLWKLLKRNRAVSVVTAVALVSLAVLWGRSAWNSHQEEKMRREQRERAVPAFVEAAHFAVERRKFDHALVQISLAVEYDPDNSAARLLKGQLLMTRGDYATARSELNQYLRLRPDDKDAAQLVELSGKARADDASSVAAISHVLRRQNALALAASLVRSREELLAMYRQQIETAWPGVGASLSMDKDGACVLAVPRDRAKNVAALTPLKGIPLVTLDLTNCAQVEDLSPLQDMPLTSLNLDYCSRVKDLTPLQGMKLTYLTAVDCRGIKDLTPLQGMPLTGLHLWNCSEMQDLSPLRGMKLTSFTIGHTKKLRDLSPLEGMPLNALTLTGCDQIQNLQVITKLPLTSLSLSQCNLPRDLNLFRGMKLTSLDISWNQQIKDLSPLRDLPLTELNLGCCPQIEDLAPLRGMKLTSLNLFACARVSDLSPLHDLPLTHLYVHGCGQLHDLSPLQGASLVELGLTVKNITRGMESLRSMKSLKSVFVEGDKRHAPADFWKRYEAGEFK